MESPETALIAEQMTHALDILRAEIASLRADLDHQREMSDRRLSTLEADQSDHENRIRSATDGVTQFKVWSGLSSGAASLLSLAAFIRTLFGGP